MLNTQVGGRGGYLIRGGRGDNRHCVAPGDMRVYQRARFGVDQASNLLEVQFLCHFCVGTFVYAAHKLRVNRHQSREAEAAQAKARHGADYFHQLPGRDVAAPDLFPDKGCGGIAGNNGAVKIKDRGDLGAAGRRLNVFQKCLEGAHGCSLWCLMSITQNLGLGVALGKIAGCAGGAGIKKPPGQRPDGVQGVKLFSFLPRYFFPARTGTRPPGPKHL